jgi:uncharacterized protein
MNKLVNEKSPYLLQHVHNPVDWYPWGTEAFEKAKKENKIIFLSIGYSTCHWCHVMEHESFENEITASLMNKHYICIKVDREERPDIDKVYMIAVQTMTGQGGWPLSVFLTPDLKPFYGGTYFPPRDAHGRPGFPTVLEKIAQVWNEERENILHSGDELMNSLQHRHTVDTRNTTIDEMILKRTYHQIAAGYDPKYAGFGTGPKFPRPVVFNFLFRYYNRMKEQEALTMALTSLMAMASGGMYDHLGGGFHRYSVDGQWRIPHFEKMLYDQAQLVNSFLDAYQLTHDEFFATVAKETLDYVLRDMTSPLGGFFSAEDADSADPENLSHKIEGAFYVWKKSEIESLLTADEAKIFCHYFSVDDTGNALADPHGEFTNKNIFFTPFTIEQTAKTNHLRIDSTKELLKSAKGKLFTTRKNRPRPHRDDKIIAGWNGLMISAFARASTIFNEPKYSEAAKNSAQFIVDHLLSVEKKQLLRRFRDGEAKFEGHLDDYSFVIHGLIDLYEAVFDIQWIQVAVELQRTQTALFWDSAEGGFYDTSGKDPSILVRTKEVYDGAEPTGNSVASLNLLRLHYLTGENSFSSYAEKALKYFCTLLEQTPQVAPQIMAAVDSFLHPPEHLIISTEHNEKDAGIFVSTAVQHYHPDLRIIVFSAENRKIFAETLSLIKELIPRNGKTTAYYCKNFSCTLPTIDIDEFRDHFTKN